MDGDANIFQVPQTAWAPGIEDPYPILQSIFHWYWCIFNSCQSSPQFTFAVGNCANTATKISKRSPRHPTVLPPEVIKGHVVRYWTGDCSSPRGAKTRPTTPKYSHRRVPTYILLQHRFDLQTSLLGWGSFTEHGSWKRSVCSKDVPWRIWKLSSWGFRIYLPQVWENLSFYVIFILVWHAHLFILAGFM